MGAVGVVAVLVAGVSACGTANTPASPQRGTELRAYLQHIEPLRLAVNDLLDKADPILEAYHDHKIGPSTARRRFGRLERRFARYAAEVAAVRPVPRDIAPAQAAYAHTYVLEDSYLSALTAAIPDRAFDELPHTADRQRAAIIAWRIRLEVLAKRLGVTLPRDLQQAGRGEIAPSPVGD
jgi:hypothetical protein